MISLEPLSWSPRVRLTAMYATAAVVVAATTYLVTRRSQRSSAIATSTLSASTHAAETVAVLPLSEPDRLYRFEVSEQGKIHPHADWMTRTDAESLRRNFDGRYDASFDEQIFQRACKNVCDRFVTAPYQWNHPSEPAMWKPFIKHLISVSEALHDPKNTFIMSPGAAYYELYFDIGTLFVGASLISIRSAFKLPNYTADLLWRNIKMHIVSENRQKIDLNCLKFPYWFELALKSPQPKDKWFAIYAFTLMQYGKHKDAQAVLQRAVSKLALCSSRYLIAQLALQKNIGSAKELCQKLLQHNPDDIETQSLLRQIETSADIDIVHYLLEAVRSPY